MNFVGWFANMMIDYFGFESDMAIGISVAIGILLLFAIIIGIASVLVLLAKKLGLIKKL